MYSISLKGKTQEKKIWQQYIKLQDNSHQLGNGNFHPLFKREDYIGPEVMLARQMRDDVVFGRPIFHLYSKPLKSCDVNYEFGGVKKPFRVIH